MYVYVYVVAQENVRICWYVGEGVDVHENDIQKRPMHSKRTVQKRRIYSPSYLVANGQKPRKKNYATNISKKVLSIRIELKKGYQ